jgi:hypothetical protein
MLAVDRPLQGVQDLRQVLSHRDLSAGLVMSPQRGEDGFVLSQFLGAVTRADRLENGGKNEAADVSA